MGVDPSFEDSAPTSRTFEISTNKQGEICLIGHLDASKLEEAAAYLSAVDADAVINLAQLVYTSSAGLNLMVATHKRLKEAGHSLKLIQATSRIRELFRLTRLDTVLQLE